MVIGTCKLCLHQKNLIRAHLVPDGLRTRLLRGDTSYQAVDFNTGEGHVLQTLEFDPEILCQECDNSIGVFDNELLQFIDTFLVSPARRPHSAEFWLRLPANTERLILALVAIVLRYSFTKRNPLSLGPIYEPILAEWVRNGKLPPTYQKYADLKVVGHKEWWKPGADGKPLDMTQVGRQHPGEGRHDNCRYYVFEYLGLSFFLRVGQTDWRGALTKFPSVKVGNNYVELPLRQGDKFRSASDGYTLPEKNDRYVAQLRAMKARRNR